MENQLDYEINKELGECYLFMGDFDKAEEYYRKAAAGNSRSSAPYMGLATVAVQRSELDKALTLYQKAAAVEETDKALCGIGLVHMEKGNHGARRIRRNAWMPRSPISKRRLKPVRKKRPCA